MKPHQPRATYPSRDVQFRHTFALTLCAPRKYTEIYARAQNFGCAHAHFIPSCISRVKRAAASEKLGERMYGVNGPNGAI